VWPWAVQPDDPADLAKYGPLPKQRAAEMRQLATAMRGMGEPEKAAYARDLAQRIQAESDPLVRVEIIQALGECRDPVALAVLKAGLEDPDSDVRMACCESWTKIGGPQAAEALGSVLGADTSAT
jgi:HEAT repeat protein